MLLLVLPWLSSAWLTPAPANNSLAPANSHVLTAQLLMAPLGSGSSHAEISISLPVMPTSTLLYLLDEYSIPS